ncbi:MAG: 50S ribosomal protein L15e [Candidatus ainarchaeum sp.]|nr:50S ribosomal protein L15e [Candidatus ainarchaeum sp.]
MGAHDRILGTFRSEYKERSPIYRARLAEWRKQPVVARAGRPTNIARARELGYKAKQGVIVVRARVGRGRRKRPKPDLGRKPTKSGRFFSPAKSLQRQAEEKASSKFVNMEAIGSYWVGQDGENKFFEIILIDRSHPAIMGDRQLSGMAAQRGRAFRGLTAAGKKGRGLTVKGIGAEKLRPSLRAWNKRGK